MHEVVKTRFAHFERSLKNWTLEKFYPQILRGDEQCFARIKDAWGTSPIISDTIDKILRYHFPFELSSSSSISRDEFKQPPNFLLDRQLQQLPSVLNSLISEYQPDCHIFTQEGKQCGMSTTGTADTVYADGFNFVNVDSRSTRSCRQECLGDFCPTWLNELVTNVPTYALISVETKREIKQFKAPIISLNLHINTSSWSFSRQPPSTSLAPRALGGGSSSSASMGRGQNNLVDAGCRILSSGQMLRLSSYIRLSLPVVASAFASLPYTISFPEMETGRYFVLNNRWKITRST